MTLPDAELIRRSLAAFEEAVDLPDEQRTAWLAAQRASDPGLATEVERLLMADAFGTGSLPTGGLLAPLRPPPSHIGRYRISERIGGGGMGEVFVGERADGLFDHSVAIKRMSPSLVPDTARALFEKERRALAQLSHRHIAQLFDGGVDETGAPYLIMELVRGPPLDRYARDQNLSVRDVVAHMASICDGVQHAHQHLIVHADLKPANILLNEAGDAKIVDFGVARILREAEAETGAIYPQTPAYASPQRRSGAAPTLYDDIYSLGMILRELLTGSSASGIANPSARPSDILKTRIPEGRNERWAAHRAHECAGDLDAIVMRACELATTGRYPSAAEMADDLRAWLEYRPLKARRGERAYVVRKFLRRRRLRVIAAGIAVVGVAASLATVSVLYARADQARQQAEQRFTDVRGLARYLLYDVYERLEKAPLTLAMRHDAVGVAQAYLDQLAQSPAANADVKREVAESYVRLADLQAGRRHSSLGQPVAAKQNLDRAERVLEELASAGPLAIDDRYREIRINLLRASISMSVDQAFDRTTSYLASAQQLLSDLPAGSAPPDLAVEALVEAADLANWQSRYADGLKGAEETIALLETLPGSVRNTDDLRDAEMRVRVLRGDALYYLGRRSDAEAEYGDIIRRATAWFDEQPGNMRARRHLIIARWALGTTLLEHDARGALRELDAAALLLPELIEFEPTDSNAIRTETVLLLARAQALVGTGRIAEGLASIQVQIEKRKARYQASPDVSEYARAYAIILAAKADLLAQNSRAPEACPIYAEANAIFDDLKRRNRVSEFDLSTGGWTLLRESMAKYCGAAPSH